MKSNFVEIICQNGYGDLTERLVNTNSIDYVEPSLGGIETCNIHLTGGNKIIFCEESYKKVCTKLKNVS